MRVACVLLGIALWLSHQKHNRDRAWSQCTQLDFKRTVALTGIVVSAEHNRVRVLRPRMVGAGAFAGTILRHSPAIGLGEYQQMIVRGRCRFGFRNPSNKQDGTHYWEYPQFCGVVESVRLVRATGVDRLWQSVFSVRERFWNWIGSRLLAYPFLHGLCRAAWFGDPSLLSDDLRRSFAQWGILHVLALSGQHVAILATLLSAGRLIVVFCAPQCRLLSWLIPLFAVSVLTVCSLFTPSVMRVAVFLGVQSLLKARAVSVPILRMVLLSVVAAVVIEPSSIAHAGWWLSVVGATCLIIVWQRSGAFWASVFVPLIMAPLVLFYFGHISLLAPVFGVLLGQVWEWVVLPVSFSLAVVPQGEWLEIVQRVSVRILGELFARDWSGCVVTGFRPSVWECLALVTLCIVSGVSAVSALRSRSRGPARHLGPEMPR